MRTQFSKLALSAALGLALTFTFSCFGGDSGGGGGEGGGGSCVGEKGNDIAKYRTTIIGDQVWMAENLDYNVSGGKCYGEGAEVHIGKDDESRPIYATLSNTEIKANREKYGRLYDWATAMALPDSCNFKECASQISTKHRGICPSGWHIPSNDEWETLINFVGIKSGTKLKATSGWDRNGNGTDDFGFSALPGGVKDPIAFVGIGMEGDWWSSTEWGTVDPTTGYGTNAYFREMAYFFEDEVGPMNNGGHWAKNYLFSVRCLKN